MARSILAWPGFLVIDPHLMDEMNFEWTPDFWQGWRESDNPYRKYKSERDRRLVVGSLQLRDGERVLEVGCGYGWISRALWGAAKIEWIGVDRSDDMISRLQVTHPEWGGRALVADASRLPFMDGEFDKVLCTGVLMHIAHNAPAVHELIRVLRPGGLLLCSINNALSPYSLPGSLVESAQERIRPEVSAPWIVSPDSSQWRRAAGRNGRRWDRCYRSPNRRAISLSSGEYFFSHLQMG